MRQDWEAVRLLAQDARKQEMAESASGEIGFAAILERDLTTATQMVAGALLHAAATGEWEAKYDIPPRLEPRSFSR